MSGGGSTSYVAGYRYKFGIHMGVCRGPVDEMVEIRVGDRTAWTGNVSANSTVPINAPELFGGESGEGGVQGDLYLMMGGPTQVAPDLLLSMMAALEAGGDGSIVRPNLVDGGNLTAYFTPGPVKLELRTDGTAWATVGTNTFRLPDQWLTNAPVNVIAAALYEVQVTATPYEGSPTVAGADGQWHALTSNFVAELRDTSGGALVDGTTYSADVFVTIRLIGDSSVSTTARIYMAVTYSNAGEFPGGGEGGGGDGTGGDSGGDGGGASGGDAAGDGSASA
jgi:hypothetical protein